MDENNENTAGCDAIAERLRALYPGQEGQYYGVIVPAFLGGNDPLDGIEAWKSEAGCPHWHYVTYGFTELYEKESNNPEESGYGFELTFRLKRGEEEMPPAWPMNLLQNLARYVFSSGNVFGAGHHMSCNGPVALEEDTKLTALGFRVDPELGEMDTPNGHMTFLQAVAITEDEMIGQMCWSGENFLGLMAQFLPLCVTDLSRASLMDNPVFHMTWEQGVQRDGSSTGFLYVDELGGRLEDGKGWLRLGAGHVGTIKTMLQARVGKGRSLYLQSQDETVCLQQGVSAGLEWEDGLLRIILSEEALQELCGLLQPHAGEYPLHSLPLTLELVPTHIRDKDGNLLETIE